MAVETTDHRTGIGIGAYVARHIREYGLLLPVEPSARLITQPSGIGLP